jgi:cell division septation protein DedD
VLAAAAAHVHAGPVQLDEARQLEAAGDLPAAARLYLAWAQEHAGQPSGLAGYEGFLRTERGLDALVDGCRELVGQLPRLPGSWVAVAHTAELFEMAGLFEEAERLAAEAWRRGGPAALLRRALRLALSMDDLESYTTLAERTGTPAELDPLAPARDLAAGSIDSARGAALRILASADEPATRLAAAWTLFAAALAVGDHAEMARAAETLGELFPDAPETVLARAAVSGAPSRLSLAPNPGLFLLPPRPAPPATAPAPGAPAAKQGTWSVQAGAFEVKENADELAKDLRKAGFAPTVREALVQGRRLFRVLAASGLDRESAGRLIERLRAAGYAGIPVGD